MFFPPPRSRSCVYSTDARQERSNSGITHCGNKYQKKIKKMWKKIFFFGAGFECRVGCLLFLLSFFSSHPTVHIQQMDFDRFFMSFLLCFFALFSEVKLDNICSFIMRICRFICISNCCCFPFLLSGPFL